MPSYDFVEGEARCILSSDVSKRTRATLKLVADDTTLTIERDETISTKGYGPYSSQKSLRESGQAPVAFSTGGTHYLNILPNQARLA